MGIVQKPTIFELQVAKSLFSRIKEGDVFVHPHSTLQYKVSLADKTLTLQNPEALVDGGLQVTHQHVVDTYAILGFLVREI